MTGQISWLSLLPIVFVFAAIAWLLRRDTLSMRKYKTEERRFLCPNLHQKVDGVVVRDAKTGTVVGVRQCSGQPGGDATHCDKACVPSFWPAELKVQLGKSGSEA